MNKLFTHPGSRKGLNGVSRAFLQAGGGVITSGEGGFPPPPLPSSSSRMLI